MERLRYSITGYLKEMTPQELKYAKSLLGLTLSQMAKMLGYEGKHGDRVVQHLLSGERTIRPAQARLMQAYLDGYRPKDWANVDKT